MNGAIPYSPRQVDLFTPGREAHFFEQGAPRTNAGLCAEMSRLAYCRSAVDFAFDRNRIQTVLAGVGFTECQFFESVDSADTRGSHCFLAHRPASNSASELAVVAFRGTDAEDPTDITRDLKFRLVPWRGGNVHRGFVQALEDVETPLLEALQSVPCDVYFTGHSLGAAMATLLASLRPPNALFTYGSPAVGDKAFVASLAAVPNERYVDCCDIVARIPPDILGYSHLGDPHYIDRRRMVTFNPGSPAMDQDRVIAAAEYIATYAWKPGNVAVRELADHAPVNYVTALP